MNYQKYLSFFPKLLILSAYITLYPLPAQSQCYMEDASGQSIDLSSLCGGSNGATSNSRSSYSSGNSRNFQIPIKRRQSGIPVVEVTLNGTKTYEMLLDTGASGTVLTVKMAQELSLKPKNIVLAETPSHSAVPFRTTIVDSIQVGKNTLKDIEVVVSPTLTIGLLGQDFFGNFDLTIKENVIEFKRR